MVQPKYQVSGDLKSNETDSWPLAAIPYVLEISLTSVILVLSGTRRARMIRSKNVGGNSMMKFCLTLLSLFSVSSGQQTLQVDWTFDPPVTLNATVGDSIQFNWPSALYHDVHIHPSGNCENTTGAFGVYPYPTNGGTALYTFLPQDGLPGGKNIFFACDVGNGIHCRNNVHQTVTVYSRTDTAAPTIPPPTLPPTPSPTTKPSTVPTPGPSPLPSHVPTVTESAAPTPISPAPSHKPTVSPAPTTTPSPTMQPSSPPTRATGAPTAFPSLAPSVSPSSATITPTSGPSTSPTPVPTVVASFPPSRAQTSSPTGRPTSFPSVAPSLSLRPSVAPSRPPSPVPTIATGFPTTQVISNTLEDLEITLFGVSELSEADVQNWEAVTPLYLAAFYKDGSNGAVEMEAQLAVQNTRRRLQSSGDSVTLVFMQTMSYRLTDPELTPASVVTLPFSTETRRDQYVSIYLNNLEGDLALTKVTNVSSVTGSSLIAPSPTPGGNEAIEEPEDSGGKVSTGAAIGIATGALFVVLFFSLYFFAGRQRRNSNDKEEDDNPYIPPSPASFGSLGPYGASDDPIEHVYTDKR